MRARSMVLGAGFGTRLHPLTLELPKPLVPLGDRPLLAHVLERLAEQGLSPAVVNAHHLHAIFRAMTAGWPQIAELIGEAEIRGTAGGVAGARGLLGPAPVLVVNGDVLATYAAGAALSRTPPDGLCMVLAPASGSSGNVGLGADDRVVRLRGERFGHEVASGHYVCAMGIGEHTLARLPDYGCLIADVALPLLRRGGPAVALAIARSDWCAPGDGIAEYLDENLAWLASQVRAPESWLGPDVRVAPGIEVVSSVLGAGAVVGGSGRLERVVAWSGARVEAPLADAVVTTAGRVVQRSPT